jgi:hypothetical protein
MGANRNIWFAFHSGDMPATSTNIGMLDADIQHSVHAFDDQIHPSFGRLSGPRAPPEINPDFHCVAGSI